MTGIEVKPSPSKVLVNLCSVHRPDCAPPDLQTFRRPWAANVFFDWFCIDSTSILANYGFRAQIIQNKVFQPDLSRGVLRTRVNWEKIFAQNKYCFYLTFTAFQTGHQMFKCKKIRNIKMDFDIENWLWKSDLSSEGWIKNKYFSKTDFLSQNILPV